MNIFTAYATDDTTISARTDNALGKKIDRENKCLSFFRVGQFSFTECVTRWYVTKLYDDELTGLPEGMRNDRLRMCARAQALADEYPDHEFAEEILSAVQRERADWGPS